jgi:CSLREA domain-containing protein
MKRRPLFWLRMGTALRFRGKIAPSGVSRNSFAKRIRFLALLVPLIGFELAISATAAIYTVDSTGDASDPVPSDGVCGTVALSKTQSGGPCTLRAAIESANSNANPDSIQFN